MPISYNPSRRANWLIVSLFTVLAVIYTWPLSIQLQTHVYGAVPNDGHELMWKMWWVAETIGQPELSPFFVPIANVPEGYSMGYGEFSPFLSVISLPITLAFNEVLTYNIVALTSIILLGWWTYVWIHYHLRRHGMTGWTVHAAALFGALLFAFYPSRVQRLEGHMNLAPMQWLVLCFLALDWWIDDPRHRNAFLIGVAATLAALSSWYYAFLILLLLPVYALVRLGKRITTVLRKLHTYLDILLAGVIVGGVCVPFLIPFLEISAAGNDVSLDSIRFWSASFVDYLVPNYRHPLWGTQMQRVMWPVADVEMPYEFMVSIPWTVLILMVVGWRHSPFRFAKWVLVIAFVLSLGPFLNLGRIPTPIPLPALLIYQFTPIGDSVRTYARFSILVIFMVTLLAGYGLGFYLQRIQDKQRQRLVAGLVFLLLGFEMWVGWIGTNPVQPRPVDVWLAEQTPGSVVMQYPIDLALSGPNVYMQRYHQQPLAYAVGTYYHFAFPEQNPDLYTFPANTAIDALLEKDVRFVLVDTTAFEITGDLEQQQRLQHVTTLGEQAVYEIVVADGE